MSAVTMLILLIVESRRCILLIGTYFIFYVLIFTFVTRVVDGLPGAQTMNVNNSTLYSPGFYLGYDNEVFKYFT